MLTVLSSIIFVEFLPLFILFIDEVKQKSSTVILNWSFFLSILASYYLRLFNWWIQFYFMIGLIHFVKCPSSYIFIPLSLLKHIHLTIFKTYTWWLGYCFHVRNAKWSLLWDIMPPSQIIFLLLWEFPLTYFLKFWSDDDKRFYALFVQKCLHFDFWRIFSIDLDIYIIFF